MRYTSSAATILLLCVASHQRPQGVYGFIVPSPEQFARNPFEASFGSSGVSPFMKSDVFLHMIKDDNRGPAKSDLQKKRITSQDVDGTGRGIYLQIVALLVCLWLFSIPPEFRRAHFCFTDECVANRSRCYDCVTFSEWKRDVEDYYENGGGVQFDFSVGDDAKNIWSKGNGR